jgi:hypothetical protein
MVSVFRASRSALTGLAICSCIFGMASFGSKAQTATVAPPVTFTAEQDHQNMMDQLGIKALRAGPSGDEKAQNHANYDESLADPFPDLPDPLSLKNGQKVTTAEMWWKQRRPLIGRSAGTRSRTSLNTTSSAT